MNREEIIAALSDREERSEIIDFWISLLEHGFSVTEILTDEGTSSVALYAPERNAADAEIFMHELNLCGVPIDCVITDDPAGREIGKKFSIACVTHDEISERVKADFVVIPSSHDYYRRRIELLHVISAEVVSLKGLLEAREIPFFVEEKLLDPCCFKACFLEWPQVSHFDDNAVHDRLKDIHFAPREYQENPERFKSLYSDIKEYSDEYIREIFQERPVIRRDGDLIHTDCTGKFVNIISGNRLTAGHPDDTDYGVYVKGGCMAYGIGADDRYTIASFLQQHINNYYGSASCSRCAVYNLGAWGETTEDSHAQFTRLDRKKKKIGIRVFRSDFEYPKGSNGKIHRYIKKNVERLGMRYIDLTTALYKMEKEVGTYLDSTHTNHRGYKAVAEQIWNDFLKPIFESGELTAGDELPDTFPLPTKMRMLREASHSLSDFFTASGVRQVGLVCDAENRDALSQLAADLTQRGGEAAILTDDAHPQSKKPEIVVAASGMKERVKAEFGAEVVSLNDLTGVTWDKYYFYPKIAEKLEGSEVHFCICFWPDISELSLLPSVDLSRISEGFASETQERNFTYLGTSLYNEIPAFSKAYLSEIVQENADAAHLKNPDRKGIAVNITDGTRQTIGQPTDAKRRVHLFGSGIAFGIGAEDRYTISSFLQEQLNLHANKTGSEPIRVGNEGIRRNRVSDAEILEQIIVPKLRSGDIHDDDIVVWLIDKRYSLTESDKKSFAYLTACLETHGIQVLDLTQALRTAQKKLAYIDKKHVNQRGNKVVAMKLYMDYVKKIVEGSIPAPLRHPQAPMVNLDDENLTGEQNAEFKEYLSYLENERRDGLAPNAKIGAIVMNCNPFTKGHRYLAERASAEVDFLYVFVVEEDKSFFPFADRFRLVSEGLSDLKNVRVLRSGKFIISTITFPGYFTKDSAKEVAVDTSLDLRLFCKFIVPALGIGTRFAGNEPTDMVTRQYNHAMKETLPQYGVKFAEFERTTNKDTVISASTVRTRLEERNWDAVRDLVPDVTYRYLRDHFGAREGK